MSQKSYCFRPGCEKVELVWQSMPKEAKILICPRCKASYGRRNEGLTSTKSK